MGPRSVVERAFQTGLLRVGFEGMRQPSRCRSELARSSEGQSADVTRVMALAAIGADVLDRIAPSPGLPEDRKFVALLEAEGIRATDARWLGTLWSPVLAGLRADSLHGDRPSPLSPTSHGPRDAPELAGDGLRKVNGVAVHGRAGHRRTLGNSSEVVRPNRRLPLTNFLGRDDDIAGLVDILRSARLVTLVGPGGVGKTRLALEVAARVAVRYADGLWMSELAPVQPGSNVLEAIASSLGVRQREVAATTDAVVDWLTPRTVLVVLDNCEHVVDPVRAFVEQILQECPSVTFLVTSREPLGLEGEHRWLTKPLSVAPPEVTDPSEAYRYEAIELFMARATALQPDFTLSSDNVGQIAAICRRLDGMPLALELAAARIPALGPTEVLGHLDDRFRLLVGSRREPRRTLRGAVDWSYGLLDDRQRLLFRRLTVFAGGWSLDACRTVCAGGELHPSDIMDILTELVAKSLVTTELTDMGTRYHMLETLRHYGQERMVELREGDDVRTKHARWARLLVERTAPGLKSHEERFSGDLVRTEIDNVREALRWAVSKLDAELAFGIIASLEDYTILRSDVEVTAWADQLLAIPEWADHPRRNVALGLVAYAAWARGDHDGALRMGRESLSSEDRHGAVPSWAAWQSIGDAAWFRGWSERAFEHYSDWVDRARQVGDDFALSSALAHLAVAGSFLDRSVAQAALADEALDLARRCGSPYLVALTLYAKSECVIDDDPAAAMKFVEDGVAIGRGSGNRFAYGLCLSTLASLTGRLGEAAAALTLYRTALENWAASGNWTNQRVLLRNLAEFAARNGEHALTARLLGALDASGEMLGAEIGQEGERLAAAVDLSRRALGDDRYDEIACEGARAHPLVLVRNTLKLLERISARKGATAASEAPDRTLGGLSRREVEVVALVATGLTNREIAGHLFISERTVDTHISRVRRKLGTTTRTALALWGVQHGLQENAAQGEPAKVTSQRHR